MATKVPLSMFESKVVKTIEPRGAGYLVTFSDSSQQTLGGANISDSSGGALVYNTLVGTAKAGDIGVVNGVISVHNGVGWKQIFPAVYA